MPQSGARFRGLPVHLAAAAVSCCLAATLDAQTLLNTRTLSSSANATPTAIATDAQGNVYVAGTTTSPDFPVDTGILAPIPATVFLTKLDPTLSQILYSTLIGPGSVSAIAVDPAGNVFLAGTTQSPSFPITPGVLGAAFNSATAGFVTKVRADGAALLYSTSLVDGIQPNAIAIDSSGDAVIVGAAPAGALPVTPGAFEPAPPTACNAPVIVGGVSQISSHAFAAELNPTASAFLYATYLSGSCGDIANDVTLDATGAAWIGGLTYSPDFPITPATIPVTTSSPFPAGFLSQLSPSGDQLEYSTLVANAVVTGLTLNPQGNVVVTGYGDLQATPGAYASSVNAGCPFVISIGPPLPQVYGWGFVLQLAPGASSSASVSLVGGACANNAFHVALDSAGDIWVAGETQSSTFPTLVPLPNLGTSSNSQSGILVELDPTGSSAISSSTSANTGVIAAAPQGLVYFAEPLPDSTRNANSVLLARINALQSPAIDLDSITYFGPARLLQLGYVPFTVAPGQAIRLTGRGIGPAQEADATSAPANVVPILAGVQVTFNGIPAELATVQASQIVCLAPFELAGATSATVQVTYLSQVSNPVTLPAVPQNIGVFAVANPDGSANSPSNPAPVNGVVTLYLTGSGQTAPPSTDGALNLAPLPVPTLVPAVTVNRVPEVPAFFGAAPGQAAGISQLNLFVPDPGSGATADAATIGGAPVTIYAYRANM